MFNKFVDIRGDLFELMPGVFAGDHYVPWYRIWILMANQLAMPNHGFISQKIRYVSNMFVSVFAEVVKVLLIDFFFADKRKIMINNVGTVTGHYIAKTLKNQKTGKINLAKMKDLDYLEKSKHNSCIVLMKTLLHNTKYKQMNSSPQQATGYRVVRQVSLTLKHSYLL